VDANSGDSKKLPVKDEEETEAEEDKDEENKINKKLKLSVGLPTNVPIEVKVMVYIIRVCVIHSFIYFVSHKTGYKQNKVKNKRAESVP